MNRDSRKKLAASFRAGVIEPARTIGLARKPPWRWHQVASAGAKPRPPQPKSRAPVTLPPVNWNPKP